MDTCKSIKELRFVLKYSRSCGPAQWSRRLHGLHISSVRFLYSCLLLTHDSPGMYEAQSAEQQRDDVQPFHGLSNNNDVLGCFRVHWRAQPWNLTAGCRMLQIARVGSPWSSDNLSEACQGRKQARGAASRKPFAAVSPACTALNKMNYAWCIEGLCVLSAAFAFSLCSRAKVSRSDFRAAA